MQWAMGRAWSRSLSRRGPRWCHRRHLLFGVVIIVSISMRMSFVTTIAAVAIRHRQCFWFWLLDGAQAFGAWLFVSRPVNQSAVVESTLQSSDKPASISTIALDLDKVEVVHHLLPTYNVRSLFSGKISLMDGPKSRSARWCAFRLRHTLC